MSQADPYKDKDTPHRDEELLRELYSQKGMNVEQISDRIGSAPSTVLRWVNKYNLEKAEETRPWRDKETLRYLFYERGYSRSDIAERFGIRYRTVNRWLRKHDLQPETPSLKHGRMAVTSLGYVQFVDYCGPEDDKRIYMHRLLACVENSLDEIAGNHVHHKIPIPWLNYRDNIEVVPPEEHPKKHAISEG